MRSTVGNEKALTLTEIMVATVIMLLTIAGILTSFLRCLELQEMARNQSMAVKASKSKLEEMNNTVFNQIKANFNNVTFTANGLNGIGVSYVNDANPNLLLIRISFCWRQANGRVVGEDKNLNGQVNAGEDTNGNGLIDSPTTLVSNIFQR